MPDLTAAQGALIEGDYRYHLWRYWNPLKGFVLWIMLNPSTADANEDDPTIRRCKGYADDWGFGGIEVCNLFALRSTDPKRLYNHCAPTGHRNTEITKNCIDRAGLIMCAWGNHGTYLNRGESVRGIISSKRLPVYALGWTNKGQPAHPLYQKKSALPITKDGIVWKP